MANILGKVLSGIGQGYLRNRQERRANLEEQQGYQKQMERKRESFDLADEYDMKQEERRRQNQLADEQRQRTNRISDEEAAYQRELSRADEMSNKKIQEIAALYPDRWKDPKFQQETTGLIKGIKVPPLPANKQIAELAMAGKIKEAMQLALKSDNPEDQQFLQTSIASIRQAEALKRLLNPDATKTPANSKAVKSKLKDLKDEYRFVVEGIDRAQRDAKDLLDDNPEKARLLLEVANDNKKLDMLRQRINSVYSNNGNSAAANSNKSLKDLLSEVAGF